MIVTFCRCSALENTRLAREIEERQRYNALQMKKSSKQQSQSTAANRGEVQKSRKSQQL